MKKWILVLVAFAGLMVVGGCGRDHEPIDEQNGEYFAEITTNEIVAGNVAGEMQNTDTTIVPAISLEDVLARAYTRREGIIKPDKYAIVDLVRGRAGQTVDITALRERPETPPIIMPLEDALYDAQVLFDILRQTYGAYIYFGGDEVFLPVFDEIIETLSTREEWNMAMFAGVLYNALSPHINDNHFVIGRRALGNAYKFLTLLDSEPNLFDRGERGIRNRKTGLYVVDLLLDGATLHQEIDEMFRLALSIEGEFYYSLVVVKPYEEVLNQAFMLTIVYENGDEEDIFISSAMPRRIHYQAPTLESHSGISVVTIRGMGWPYAPERGGTSVRTSASARQFLDFADELQDEPVIIIDVRSNIGGNSRLGPMWFERLLNENVPSNFLSLVSIDNTEILAFIEHVAAIPEDVVLEHDAFYLFIDGYGFIRYDQWVESVDLIDGVVHEISNNLPDRIISNDILLIFLTDRYTVSAGEAFADLAFNIENTLVIGQNTAGMLNTSGGSALFLPRSGQHISFGHFAHVHPPGHLPEGIGLTPDIWVHGDALAATFAMLESQGLR